MKNTKDLKFEVLESNRKRILFLIGIVCVVALLVALVVRNTLAKYRTAQSMPLINGTVNYTLYDFKMVAMYQENESGEYESIDVMPSSGYAINEENSYCEIDGEKDVNVILRTVDGNHTFANLQRGTKCYLYFDVRASIKDTLLTYYPTVLTRSDFSTPVTNTTTRTVYSATDDDGTTYYFAGAPTDNWVYFAGFYWRIIRINGDGSVRLIYQGTSANTTGTGTQIGTSAFNSSYNDNMYVGYMYTTSGSVHGLGISSTIKGVLDTWYSNNLSNYTSYIDTNAGFCGDRTPYSGTGTGATETYYDAYNRLATNKTPTFSCSNSSDLYTTSSSSKGNKALSYPIGLMTADEVAYAGGVYGTDNSSYYLYTSQNYWTMSPFVFSSGWATVFNVNSSGSLYSSTVWMTPAVRPVINLRSDIELTGTGTSDDPFRVVA